MGMEEVGRKIYLAAPKRAVFFLIDQCAVARYFFSEGNAKAFNRTGNVLAIAVKGG